MSRFVPIARVAAVLIVLIAAILVYLARP